MARTVCLSPGAYADIRAIARYISRRVSAVASNRWQTRLDRWPEAAEAAVLGLDLREMLRGRRPHVYRVLFTIDGNTVNVQRVRHAAQNQLTEDDV